jgi:hypothetical protein
VSRLVARTYVDTTNWDTSDLPTLEKLAIYDESWHFRSGDLAVCDGSWHLGLGALCGWAVGA